ncbi:MAG: acyl-CoA thioesterase [Burkholderiaceae bacterium]|nr:acyl-CoA thioesterase [Burkholderiaceae bacterium]
MDTATGRTTTMSVDVRPGDCDPAGIVCLARFQRWIEAASTNHFTVWGPAPTRHGGVATVLLEQRARFVRSATDGDKLLIRTHVEEGPPEVFVQRHVITCDDELIGECTETRRFCCGDPQSA